MTDDELDRALFALPLEEPPAELHRRVLAATVLRPAPAFRPWELIALIVALGVVTLLTAYVFTSVPHAGSRLAATIVAGLRELGLFSRSTYVWLAIGLSTAWWISSLPFMGSSRTTVYNG